jgi:hypothetical protein
LFDEGGAGISDTAPPPLDELVDELLAPELDAPLLDEDDELLELDEELVDPLEDVEPELPEEEEEPELLAAAPSPLEPPPHPARKPTSTNAPANETLEGLPHWFFECNFTSPDWTLRRSRAEPECTE